MMKKFEWATSENDLQTFDTTIFKDKDEMFIMSNLITLWYQNHDLPNTGWAF